MLMTILLNTFGGMPPSPMIATGTIVHCVLYASIAMPVSGSAARRFLGARALREHADDLLVLQKADRRLNPLGAAPVPRAIGNAPRLLKSRRSACFKRVRFRHIVELPPRYRAAEVNRVAERHMVRADERPPGKRHVSPADDAVRVQDLKEKQHDVFCEEIPPGKAPAFFATVSAPFADDLEQALHSAVENRSEVSSRDAVRRRLSGAVSRFMSCSSRWRISAASVHNRPACPSAPIRDSGAARLTLRRRSGRS